MDVSIILVNYNTCQMTNECINSIFHHVKDISIEIILVDNASEDESKFFFSKDKRIKYIYSDINLGFGKANNLGAENANGKYLFLLNSDTVLLNNAVKIFFDFAENASKKIACIGCLLKDKELKVTHSYGDFPNVFNTIDEWIFCPVLKRIGFDYVPKKYDPPHKFENDFFYAEYITGAAIFLKKEICDKLGLFDKDYFMYYEETDMQYRYKKQGYQSVIVKGPEIIHIMEGSGKSSKLLKRLLPLQSLFLFFKKNKNKLSLQVLKIMFKILYIPLIKISDYELKEKKNFYNLIKERKIL